MRQPHRLSQCAKILRVLEDGRPHLVSEIHAIAGYSRLNSRISELRKRGYAIESFHVEGKQGSEGYGYRLLDSPSVVAATDADGESSGPVPSAADELTASGSQRVPLPSPARSTQLTLEAA